MSTLGLTEIEEELEIYEGTLKVFVSSVKIAVAVTYYC